MRMPIESQPSLDSQSRRIAATRLQDSRRPQKHIRNRARESRSYKLTANTAIPSSFYSGAPCSTGLTTTTGLSRAFNNCTLTSPQQRHDSTKCGCSAYHARTQAPSDIQIGLIMCLATDVGLGPHPYSVLPMVQELALIKVRD